LTDAEHIEASREAWRQAAERTYREQLATNTLTELEDIYAHLDRVAYPGRFQVVREEIDKRLAALERRPVGPEEALGPASLWRRIWAAFLDLFVMLLIVVAVYALATGIAGIWSSFGEQATETVYVPPRRGPSPFVQFLTGLPKGDAQAWTNWDQWRALGTGVALYLGVRAAFLIPLWARSGRTPGMRELGLQVQSADGSPVTWRRAAARFVSAYALGLLTLGLGALMSLRRADRRTLHDRVSGTRVIRLPQSWAKPRELRLLD
jgi:uncharacterized RDD family membrane protein YckC